MFFKVLILLVFEVNLAFSLNGECPTGWKNYNGHCYFIGKDKMSWFDAKKFCENHQAYLAVITSEKENMFLVQQLIIDDRDHYWLGGTDMGHEGTWTWESTGEVLAFSKWNTGQPDNSASKQHCLLVQKPMKYNWDDGGCGSALNFVCEKDEYKCNRCENPSPCPVQQLMKSATKKN